MFSYHITLNIAKKIMETLFISLKYLKCRFVLNGFMLSQKHFMKVKAIEKYTYCRRTKYIQKTC